MTDQINICNRALLSIGARTQISSITPSDGSPEGNACSILFQPTFEQLARTAQWNCLRQQVSLTLLLAAQGTPENPTGTTPSNLPTPWLYAYAYPSDCLALRFIVPSFPANDGSTVPLTTLNNSSATWLPSGGQIPFVVATLKDSVSGSNILVILTNQSQAQGVYTLNDSNPAIWDSQFQAAMVASLGAFLVPALSLSLPLMELCIKTAQLIIAQARAADGNEGVTTMDHTPDWMWARNGSGGYWGLGSGLWNPFLDMAWPSSGSYG